MATAFGVLAGGMALAQDANPLIRSWTVGPGRERCLADHRLFAATDETVHPPALDGMPESNDQAAVRYNLADPANIWLIGPLGRQAPCFGASRPPTMSATQAFPIVCLNAINSGAPD